MANQGAELFEKHRGLLFGIAYRMLGSVTDAEDMVQETFLRWQKNSPTEIKSAEAWLVTVVTRLSINHLKLARVRREEYVGSWLPEPVIPEDTPNPRENVQQAESLSIAFLVILETLSPTERAVYLLKEVFGYKFGEVARMVQKSEPNCRQLLRRARRRIDERCPRFKSSPDRHKRLAEAFLEATNRGDMKGLLAVLSEDVTLITDGGAAARAPRRPIVGADAVSRLLLQGAPREAAASTVTRLASVNGWPGFLAYRGQTPRAAVAFDIDGDRIRTIYLMANPEKLARLPGGERLEANPSFHQG
jgi:RNA polymerase sigma-70 factor, ECF subfamily